MMGMLTCKPEMLQHNVCWIFNCIQNSLIWFANTPQRMLAVSTNSNRVFPSLVFVPTPSKHRPQTPFRLGKFVHNLGCWIFCTVFCAPTFLSRTFKPNLHPWNWHRRRLAMPAWIVIRYVIPVIEFSTRYRLNFARHLNMEDVRRVFLGTISF